MVDSKENLKLPYRKHRFLFFISIFAAGIGRNIDQRKLVAFLIVKKLLQLPDFQGKLGERKFTRLDSKSNRGNSSPNANHIRWAATVGNRDYQNSKTWTAC